MVTCALSSKPNNSQSICIEHLWFLEFLVALKLSSLIFTSLTDTFFFTRITFSKLFLQSAQQQSVWTKLWMTSHCFTQKYLLTTDNVPFSIKLNHYNIFLYIFKYVNLNKLDCTKNEVLIECLFLSLKYLYVGQVRQNPEWFVTVWDNVVLGYSSTYTVVDSQFSFHLALPFFSFPFLNSKEELFSSWRFFDYLWLSATWSGVPVGCSECSGSGRICRLPEMNWACKNILSELLTSSIFLHSDKYL